MAIRNRIISREFRTLDRLRPHPLNWRIHPDKQRCFLLMVLGDVGMVDDVVCTQDGTLIDGHLRYTLAKESNEDGLWCAVTDLTGQEVEAALLMYDHLATYAVIDADAMEEMADAIANDRASRDVLISITEDQPSPYHQEIEEVEKIEFVKFRFPPVSFVVSERVFSTWYDTVRAELGYTNREIYKGLMERLGYQGEFRIG